MLKWTKAQKKIAFFFALAILAAMFSTSIPVGRLFHLYDLSSYLYIGIIIAWGFLVHQRILNTGIRKYLDLATIFMILLFVSRLFRWGFFPNDPIVSEYAWYFYYVSFTMVPVCCFFAALFVGRVKGEEVGQGLKWIWLVEAVFVFLLLTNVWHELLFVYVDRLAGDRTYGPLYYACLIWGLGLTLVSFYIILRRCKVREARKLWFIPGLSMLLGILLMALYYACGGSSPMLFGLKIYNLQEVYCLSFVLPFECMIQLGILPNNSRHELFFQKVPIRAAILDKAGRIAYESGDYRNVMAQGGPLTDGGSLTDGLWNEGDQNRVGHVNKGISHGAQREIFRRSEQEIPGGSIVWYEDMTAIIRIREEIAKVTEELEEENDLILQENEIRAERISYETKNRLYDKIAQAVKSRAISINELLNSEDLKRKVTQGDESWKDCLTFATVQGVYVKRMGNLMLIAEENKTISTKELAISIKESLDYFALSGRTQDLREKGEGMIPSGLILLAFELYERVMELAYDQIYSMEIRIDGSSECLLSIAFDAGEEFGEKWDGDWKREELCAHGAMLRIRQEDETWHVRMLVN